MKLYSLSFQPLTSKRANDVQFENEEGKAASLDERARVREAKFMGVLKRVFQLLHSRKVAGSGIFFSHDDYPVSTTVTHRSELRNLGASLVPRLFVQEA